MKKINKMKCTSVLFGLSVFLIGGNFFNCKAEVVKTHYQQIKICEGDSFPLQKYLKNEVEVPVDFELLGWKDLDTDYLTVGEDTTIMLEYRHKGDSKVEGIPFSIRVQKKPQVALTEKVERVCLGGTLTDVRYQATHCDRIYWEEVSTGKIEENLTDFGPVEMGKYEEKGEKRYRLVGTNEVCAEAAVESLLVMVRNPNDLRMSVQMPDDIVDVCDNELIDLLRYVSPKSVKFLYGEETIAKITKCEDMRYEVVWEREDDVVRGLLPPTKDYFNRYTLKLKIEEPMCNTTVSWIEEHTLRFQCEETKKREFSTSYQCEKGESVIYWGAEEEVEDVSIEMIGGGLPVSVSKNSGFNAETVEFPYKGSLKVCWEEDDQLTDDTYSCRVMIKLKEKLKEKLEENLEWNTLIIDTIEMKRCEKRPSFAMFECEKGKPYIYVGSDEIVTGISLEGGETNGKMNLKSEKRRNDRQSGYLYSSTHSIASEYLSKGDERYFVTLDYVGCRQENKKEVMEVDVFDCRKATILYYGAYRSPSTILLQKSECDVRQCSNVLDGEPSVVTIVPKCCGDTVYFRFKLVGESLSESYEIRFDEDDLMGDVFVSYPSIYDDLGGMGYVFWNKEKNPVLGYVPREDGMVSGTMGGIPFSFRVEVAPPIVKSDVEVCKGTIVDLSKLVREQERENVELRWNVSDVLVSPLKDSEYYLYGVDRNGCEVDEKVKVKIAHPLWVAMTAESVCAGTSLETEEMLNSNATRVEWFQNGEKFDNQSLYFDSENRYEAVLYSACDTMRKRLDVSVVECADWKEEDEDEDEEEEDKDMNANTNTKAFGLKIPRYFSPNGDDDNDEWKVEGLEENYNHWRCQIFDRYGKLLMTKEDEPVVWDGMYRGVKMPSTDYWYSLSVESRENPIVGHFTLKRTKTTE